MLHQHRLIDDLEAEIDELREAAERCRKLDLAAKAALGVGCGLLIIAFLRFSALALTIGIAASLVAVVLIGSNRTTLGEIVASIRMAEGRRAEIIDGLEFQSVAPK
jgi:hypothetical protein